MGYEAPYNVSVGGTDFEDMYNAKRANRWSRLSTYWNPTNTADFGSAQVVHSGDAMERCLRQHPDR